MNFMRLILITATLSLAACGGNFELSSAASMNSASKAGAYDDVDLDIVDDPGDTSPRANCAATPISGTAPEPLTNLTRAQCVAACQYLHTTTPVNTCAFGGTSITF